MQPLAISDVLEPVTCGQCGLIFGMSRNFMEAKINDGKIWHCPNGHERYFTQTVKLKEKLKDTEQRLHAALSRENTLIVEREKQIKRLKAGVCPCCKRTFKQLSAHMKTKHPRYGKKKK